MGNPEIGQGTTTGGVNWIGYLTAEYNKTRVYNYNLAVGGATLDNDIVENPGYPYDVVSQVALFESVYKNQSAAVSWSSNNAVFGSWIGVNDAGNSWWLSDPQNFTASWAQEYETLLDKLYSDGGRKFLILNVPPIHRSPFWISQGSDSANALGAYLPILNKAIKNFAQRFQRHHRDATVVHYDTFTLMSSIMDHPTRYGYPNATAASCEADNGRSCVWWNSLHPGERFHQLMAADIARHASSLGAW
ncbi:hypothetical protein FE257_009139 [Aspergillus nanangensis]|uniref:Carbohydrate esterase family 16 protein n=1 Tax=Aspergillus nanangensis TaxID=2582783 RepID=A0AAD4CWT4_ASPNN|nr:hypothetical protein FE257_009139 [Aspergillus nanangensis]